MLLLQVAYCEELICFTIAINLLSDWLSQPRRVRSSLLLADGMIGAGVNICAARERQVVFLHNIALSVGELVLTVRLLDYWQLLMLQLLLRLLCRRNMLLLLLVTISIVIELILILLKLRQTATHFLS